MNSKPDFGVRPFVLFFTFCLIFASFNSVAQEQLGLKLSNYSGINSTFINPAWTATSKFNWDVNLVAGGAFFQNNYGFLENTSVMSLLKSDFNFASRPDLNGETPGEGSIIADYYRGNNKKQIHLSQFVTGPSVMVKVGNHSFGVTTNFRAMASSTNIPASLGYYQLSEQALNEPFTVDPFQVSGMAWSEIGLNFSTKLMETYDGSIYIGGSVKFLQGYEAFYFDNQQQATITLLPQDTASLQTINVGYGFASNVLFDDATGESYDFQRNGSGIGFDLGAVFTMGEDGEGNYKLKLGASLLDVGKITFKERTEQHQLTLDPAFLVSLDDYENIDSREELVNLVSSQVFGDSAQSFVDGRFGMALPTALSVQADLAVAGPIFVNAAVVRRIAGKGSGLKRTNIIAVTPRVEWRWLEVSVPVSLVNDKWLQVGTSVRLGPLTVGSENLGGMFNSKDELTGSDFYVALKINPFFTVNKGGSKGSGRGKSGNVKCYNF
ncbi:MAG: DUF5723 family protein [Bacteroidota bacterium]